MRACVCINSLNQKLHSCVYFKFACRRESVSVSPCVSQLHEIKQKLQTALIYIV